MIGTSNNKKKRLNEHATNQSKDASCSTLKIKVEFINLINIYMATETILTNFNHQEYIKVNLYLRKSSKRYHGSAVAKQCSECKIPDQIASKHYKYNM